MIQKKNPENMEAYTLKVPETVSLADLTADSMSNTPTREPPPLLSSGDLAAAYEFQSASRDDEALGWTSFSLTPPENQFCIVVLNLLLTGYSLPSTMFDAITLVPCSTNCISYSF